MFELVAAVEKKSIKTITLLGVWTLKTRKSFWKKWREGVHIQRAHGLLRGFDSGCGKLVLGLFSPQCESPSMPKKSF